MKAACLGLASVPLLGLLAACGDSNGPDLPTVSASAVVTATSFGTNDTMPSIECDVTVHAMLSGDNTLKLAWGSGIFRFYNGKDRSVPVDTQIVSANAVDAAWQGPPTVGFDRQTAWRFTGGYPFQVDIEFHYQYAGPQATAIPDHVVKASITCGPPVPASLVPPAIPSVTVAPQADVTYGDSVSVTYTATSSAGVWLSAVSVCGTQHLFFDRALPIVHRSVTFPVPPVCAANRSLAPQVAAVDFVREVSQTAGTGPMVYDNTPPTVSGTRLSGTVWVGDTVYFYFNTSDNGLVSAVVWTLPTIGVRDSILINQHTSFVTKQIVVPPSWAGADSILVFARDAAGLVSDTLASGPSRLAIRPTVVHPVRTVQLEAVTYAQLSDTKRGLFYFLDTNGKQLVILSSVTLTPVGSVQFSSGPADMDFTASGDSLVISLPYEYAVAFLNLDALSSAPTLLAVTARDTAGRPWNLRVSHSGRLFVSLWNPASGNPTRTPWPIAEIDLATASQQVRTDVTGWTFARSDDRRVLVFNGGGATGFARYLDSTNSVGAARSSPGSDGPVVVSPDGQNTAMSWSIYGPDLLLKTPVKDLNSPNYTEAVAFSSDGQYVFHLYGNYIYRARVADGQPVDRFIAPAPGMIWPTPGTNLVTTQAIQEWPARLSNLAVIDLSQVTATPPVARASENPVRPAPVKPVELPQVQNLLRQVQNLLRVDGLDRSFHAHPIDMP